MKKYLFIMFFLCWTMPFTADAEEILNQKESFQVASSFKIGRKNVMFNGMGSVAVSTKLSDGKEEGASVAHYCNSLCDDCVYTSGTCLKCKDPEHKMLSGNRSDNDCVACPDNATCNGVSFTCNTGYYKSGNRCMPCSTISVTNGTCSACNASTGTCTQATCNSGYAANGAQCVKCGSIVNGTCTACTYANNTTICTAGTCNTGYGFMNRRADSPSSVQWEAGCYPKGDCTSYTACMFVSQATGKGQCKSEGAWSSSECTACGEGTMWVEAQKTCASCSTISVEHGTCTACLNGACTALQCDGNYHPNDAGTACVRDQCVMSTDCAIMNGTCTSCNNGVCTAGTCNSGYAFRTRRAGEWDAGCYPTNGCSSYANNATCHFVNESTGKGQCKTDNTFSSMECNACPSGSHWVTSSSNICGYGSCVSNTACSTNNPGGDPNGWIKPDGGHGWNYDGAHTIPNEARCWDGYGHYSTITVPSGARYTSVLVRFWGTATVNGSFETDTLEISNGTSTTTFNGSVTAGKVKLETGKTAKFKGGLKGKPKCVVIGNGATGTCSCNESECHMNATSCNTGYYLSNGACVACSTISVTGGTCTACSIIGSNETCTGVSCKSGYYVSGTSCAACSSISVANGSCTACNSSTGTCTAISCNSGYYSTGTSCAACSNVSVANGTCTACNSSTGDCTAVSCNYGYKPNGTSCEKCTKAQIQAGLCGVKDLYQNLNLNNFQLADPVAPEADISL